MTAGGVTVADCVAALEDAYPPGFAESWDAVGLSVGEPDAHVGHVHFAVDPTVEVAAEAVALGAGLLVTHHPLFLRGVHGVAATTAGGRVATSLIRGGAALFTAHTNADVACAGVNDALAAALGLTDVRPLAEGRGNPGLGRLGDLAAAEPLSAFCARVGAALPATAGGVRATGDPDRPVRRVAVCGGSGGELAAAAAAAGADAFLTADGRHHHVLDAVAAHGVAIVDVAHWASEWPWLAYAAERLVAALSATGRTVVTSVSTLVTDPWRLHVPQGTRPVTP
ncbi:MULTISPECIES: Nif3-like dinuclear metal center hexameric protein [unclassified Pseudofrankia]|uniref:Nif3-like dinuclear metal center hexameric protein n=1 Tax=unclassified Pseudofrankia TaxID=2994372 RepID=UPI0008D99B9E|nr:MULTISPECIES: Nif3-like dinuclear metal center hexameric protein [unclassified Pseudofrankia]MDT3443458.1 Nif3-like dinuclear metal center hexameric protein [Pseudofrankia sp. BMG5.37]OHV45350.1 Nif3-like dinuclear metal center hexameric protein [Pseudofrankia sp. BMG5.36]